MQKLLTIFLQKNIITIDSMSTVRLKESSANDFFKLMMIRTAGPRALDRKYLITYFP